MVLVEVVQVEMEVGVAQEVMVEVLAGQVEVEIQVVALQVQQQNVQPQLYRNYATVVEVILEKQLAKVQIMVI